MIYNILLVCGAIFIAPRIFYQYVFYRKYRSNLLFRLGLKLPKIVPKKAGEYRIWVHAVSLGETKAVAALLDKIQEERKDAVIVFSSTTETGQKEGQKKIAHCFFLPLDLSWLMKRLVKKVEPDLFILVETDFWYNLLTELKKNQTKIAVVNGKISKASYENFSRIPFFSRKLFDAIDLFCVQSEVDKERFVNLGIPEKRIEVTGNLKFDIKKALVQASLQFPLGKKLVTIASTHEGEESKILSALEKVEESICFLLAPRHPERFTKVATLLKRQNIPFRTLSEQGTGLEKVVLIDQMGVMDACYAVSKVAIMGGSFIPHVGGHNIYEPVTHGIPVIYGQHMHKQEGLVNSLKKHNIGKQVTLSELYTTLESLINSQEPLSTDSLKAEVEGATARSWNLIKQRL